MKIISLQNADDFNIWYGFTFWAPLSLVTKYSNQRDTISYVVRQISARYDGQEMEMGTLLALIELDVAAIPKNSPLDCAHTFINVGFSSICMVCTKCDQEQS